MFWFKILRFGIVLFSYLLLCSKPDTPDSFFRSLLIFSLGFLYDYATLSVNAKNNGLKIQKIISNIGIAFSLIFIFFGIIGLSKIIILDIQNSNIRTSPLMEVWNFCLDFKIFLRTIIIFPFLTGCEFFIRFQRYPDININKKNLFNEAISAKSE